MKHSHFFNSAMLQSAEYDEEAKELTVTFTNGKPYVYDDVPIETYREMISAESAGRYFNSIKSQLKIKKPE